MSCSFGGCLHYIYMYPQLNIFCAAKVIMDRDTGRSRGFGFVNFADEEAAKSALTAMDGQVRFIYFFDKNERFYS